MRNLTAVIWKEYNHDISVKMSVCNVTMATKALKFGRIFAYFHNYDTFSSALFVLVLQQVSKFKLFCFIKDF